MLRSSHTLQCEEQRVRERGDCSVGDVVQEVAGHEQVLEVDSVFLEAVVQKQRAVVEPSLVQRP